MTVPPEPLSPSLPTAPDRNAIPTAEVVDDAPVTSVVEDVDATINTTIDESDVAVAEVVEGVGAEDAAATDAQQPTATVKSDDRTLPFWLGYKISSGMHWLFGLASLICGLGVLAAMPVLQVFSLGYLLEASGRVARTGKLSQGFIGVRTAGRVGSMVLGTYLFFLPLQIVTAFWYEAALIDPASGVTAGWRIGQMVLAVITVVHIITVWFCGGKFRHFFWPLLAGPFLAIWFVKKVLSLIYTPNPSAERLSYIERLWRDISRHQPLTSWFPPAIILSSLFQGKLYTDARDAVWDFAVGLRVHHYFWLGLRGAGVALVWLSLPVGLLILSMSYTGGMAAILGIQRAFLLGLLLLFLPFLQTNCAKENSFGAGFAIGDVARMFIRAPIAFWFALTITLLFALPLYLLKIEATPRELTWLPSLVFVAFIFPARLLTGWAAGRGAKREKPRFPLSWLAAFALAVPVVAFNVLIVFVSQYVLWGGKWSMFEQHAFLFPAPFLGM